MSKFTIIPTTSNPCIDRDAFQRNFPADTLEELSDRIDDYLDSLYDGFDPVAIGEDGALYSVMFAVSTGDPLLWAKIGRKEAAE